MVDLTVQSNINDIDVIVVFASSAVDRSGVSLSVCNEKHVSC